MKKWIEALLMLFAVLAFLFIVSVASFFFLRMTYVMHEPYVESVDSKLISPNGEDVMDNFILKMERDVGGSKMELSTKGAKYFNGSIFIITTYGDHLYI